MAALWTQLCLRSEKQASQGPAPGNGTGWIPSYSSQVGFRPDVAPGAGEIVSSVAGTVTDPGKLAGFGLGAEKGDRIKMIFLGNDEWKILNVKTGRAVAVRDVNNLLKVK